MGEPPVQCSAPHPILTPEFPVSLCPSRSCLLSTPTSQWQEAGQLSLSSPELVSPNFPLWRTRLFVRGILLLLTPSSPLTLLTDLVQELVLQDGLG